MSGRRLWVVALAAWFCLWGLFAISNFRLEASNLILGVLALLVAILAVLDR